MSDLVRSMQLAPHQARRGFFTRKKLDLTIRLGKGDWGQAGFDTIKLTDHRVSASVNITGGAGLSAMQLRIWGLKPSHMNRIATLGIRKYEARSNTVLLEAGDADSPARSIVHHGDIVNAWTDFQGQPDVPFVMEVNAHILNQIKPVPPRSHRGLVDVPAVMQSLATQMGYAFENSGVSSNDLVKVVDQYLSGSAKEQAKQLADAANIMVQYDDTTIPSTMCIYPKGQGRKGGAIPVISPRTGMVGYPTFTGTGIVITTLYNPSLRFGIPVRVESSIEAATQLWYLYNITHTLDAEIPNGNWFSRIECRDLSPGQVQVVSPRAQT